MAKKKKLKAKIEKQQQKINELMSDLREITTAEAGPAWCVAYYKWKTYFQFGDSLEKTIWAGSVTKEPALTKEEEKRIQEYFISKY